MREHKIFSRHVARIMGELNDIDAPEDTLRAVKAYTWELFNDLGYYYNPEDGKDGKGLG